MRKKLLAILLAAAMLTGLVACGNGNSTTPANTNSSAITETTENTGTEDVEDTDSQPAIDTSEHVVITYMTTGDKPTGDMAVTLDAMLKELNAILTEKVNAELEIYYIPWTDYLSNYNLTLARMDGSVDLVVTGSDWLDSWPNAKNGAFLELSEEMLKTYAPQTWASVPAENWELCKYEGDIYLFPEDNYAQWTNHGFIYRIDWARDAGLADGVHSWADMTEYFRWVKENVPELKIPWDSDGAVQGTLAGGYIASNSNYVAIDGISAGAMWGGNKDDLYTVYSPYMTETDLLVAFAKMMKEWDEIGVWKTDVLNNSSSTNRDDYKVGLVAADQHHTQTWTGLVSHTLDNKIYDTDPDAETGFFYFGEESKNLVAMSITHGAMAISAASKNPERALMVYDLLRNDAECYRLMCYGQQGISWDINEDGLRITPEGYNADTQNLGGMTNYWGGRNDDLEIKSADRNRDAIDALYEEYDSIKIEYPYGQYVPDVDNVQSQINNISEIHMNYMKQIAYGKYSGSAEDIVEEYQEALKQAGIDDVTAELQKQFDALYK